MSFFAGVDVGSSAAKAVVIDDQARELGRGLSPSGADLSGSARRCFAAACRQAGIAEAEVERIVACGFGRDNVDFAHQRRTEIDCHARGAYHHLPRAITVVDIGGQDNKVIRIDENGRRLNFTMNRKCAAGTGAFLEEVALRLKVPLDKLAELAGQATDPSVRIGSFCTVFAMTEILSRIRAGVRVEDLARAALESVARRVLEVQSISGQVVATGGVMAHQPLMREILSQQLQAEVFVPPHAQYVGALGAALVGRR
ncbi:MAG: ATPase [Deltaproteobacteria bacterium]|nr:MAG: ATPase [Deltaproteobacteria bacterium]